MGKAGSHDTFESDDPALVGRATDLSEVESLVAEINRRVSKSVVADVERVRDVVREATHLRAYELSRFCEGDKLEFSIRDSKVVTTCRRRRRPRASERGQEGGTK